MIEIIPAIDIIEGKAVRLSQGNYEQKKIYNQDPLEVAKKIENHGIHRLHLVDLDGAKANCIVNYKTLEKIASHTSLIIDFGGGLKSESDLKIAFNNGAKMVTGGSIAVKNPKIFQGWINRFGETHILLGADCKDNKIVISGWTEKTNEEVIPFIKKWRKCGITKAICTDISKDGMLKGTSIELYKAIKQKDTNIYLIASGGVSCINDIDMLQEAGLSGVIIGKAIYEGKIQLKELEKYAC